MRKRNLVIAAICLSLGITACTAEAKGYTEAAVETENSRETAAPGQSGEKVEVSAAK